MLRRQLGCSVLVTLWACFLPSGRCWAHEVQARVNNEKIAFLIRGMDAVRSAVSSVRARLHSVQSFVRNRGGKRQKVEIIVDTDCIILGNRFRRRIHLRQLFDGKPPPPPKPGARRHPIAELVQDTVYNGENVMTYEPDKNKAFIRRAKEAWCFATIDRIHQDPLFHGLSVCGLSLRELVEGKHWIPRGWIRKGEIPKVTVRWRGTKLVDGREIHVVEIDDAWHTQQGEVWERRTEVWIDPSRGFTVPFVSVKYRKPGGWRVSEVIETTCARYNEGLWGPAVTKHKITFDTGRVDNVVIKVLSLEFNTHVSEEELKITLPLGTWIDDEICKMLYRYDPGGESFLKGVARSLVRAGVVGGSPGRRPTALVPREKGEGEAVGGAAGWKSIVALCGFAVVAAALMIAWRTGHISHVVRKVFQRE